MVKLLFFSVLLQLRCLCSQQNLFVTVSLYTDKFLVTVCLLTGEFSYSGPLFMGEFVHGSLFDRR
jgi:hypothetical protein